MRHRHMHRPFLTSAAVLCACASAALAENVDRRVAAFTGQQAVGAEPGVTYGGLFLPSLFRVNDAGEIAFLADLQGAGVTPENDFAIVSELGGAARLVTREGANPPAPLSGFTQSAVNLINVSPAGNVLYSALIEGPGVTDLNRLTIWAERDGAFELVARDQQQAPGLPPGVRYWGGHRLHQINDSGQLARSADVSDGDGDPANDQAVWVNRGAIPTLIARTGDHAPGTSPATAFAHLGSGSSVGGEYHIDDQGRAAFLATVAGPGVTEANDTGIWAVRDGQLRLVAIEQDFTMDPVGAPIFTRISDLTVSPGGVVAFSAIYRDDIDDTFGDSGVFFGEPGDVRQMVRRDADAPGTDGARFLLINGPVVNDAGAFAFDANLIGGDSTGANNHAIFIGTSVQNTHLAVREGDQVPGLPAGVVFERPEGVALNNAGQVAFSSELIGPGVTPFNDAALFITDGSGVPHLALRTGETIDVSGEGDLRVVSTLFPVRALSDGGHVATTALFTDGSSALIVSGLAAGLCPGDCDDSGTVDFNDLVEMLFNFNLDFVPPECDPTGDAQTTFDDLVAGLFLFGLCE